MAGIVTHGGDLARIWRPEHPRDSRCVRCAESCSTVALTKLAYTFEPCDCDSEPYVHLTERLWHRDCLAAHEAGA
jgi:hypothetical protein